MVVQKDNQGNVPGAIPFQGVEALPRTLELVRNGKQPETPAGLRFVNQTRLPNTLVIDEARYSGEVIDAMKTLALRGAPAIGVAGAAALVLFAFNESRAETTKALIEELEEIAQCVATARPTAVNLSWGVNRMMSLAKQCEQAEKTLPETKQTLFDEVKNMEASDEETNRRIGKQGAALLPPQSRVLTHCNAGSLATVFFGTALGVIYVAAAEGKIAHVYSDETRPVGQGARLTVWELAKAGIPTTLLCDDMAAVLMAQGKIDAVIVGADRICRNGDTANKIGTYNLAIAAQYHHIPFYVAAPASSIDVTLLEGKDVEIEYRLAAEVSPVILSGVEVFNPAFDITLHELITAIITQDGVFMPADLAAFYTQANAATYC